MNFVDSHEEQIHIPGYIQSFGYLIGLDAADLRIRFCSENIYSLFKIDEDILGWKITDFADFFSPILDSPVFFESIGSKTQKYNYGLIKIQNTDYYLTVFTYQSTVYIELEARSVEADTGIEILKGLINLRTESVEENIWDELVERLVKIIPYDRILVYKFLEDGSGTVIAEYKLDHVESYLGLYYPAADIPSQVRELYKLKHHRIFSNVYAENVPILSKSSADIDLTYSNLRAMSPVHGQYLKNAGTASSFSTSIIINEELWGLVTFHNSRPQHIDYSKRIQAEMLTQMSAKMYTSYLYKSNMTFVEQMEAKLAALKARINQAKTLPDGITSVLAEIRELLNVEGIAYMCLAGLFTEGHTPDSEQIIELRTSELFQKSERLAATNYILADIPNANPELPGVLLIKLDDSDVVSIMGFRKEFTDHKNWAGAKEKQAIKVQDFGDQLMVSPRTSFNVFSENVKGKSKEWTPQDMKSAERLREILLECSVEHMARVEFLNEELIHINKDLESFIYTISHDTATPLSVIKLNAQSLLRSGDPEKINNCCDAIIKEVDHISGFFGDLLTYSKAKYANMSVKAMDPRPIIEEVVRKLMLQYSVNPSDIYIGDTPPIICDAMLANQIFQNVIGNAVKYSSKQESPKIQILGEDKGAYILYHIIDNGIGIDREQGGFKMFERSENATAFEGNGLGLHIVQRIMDRLGGEIYHCPAEGGGTHFTVKFKK